VARCGRGGGGARFGLANASFSVSPTGARPLRAVETEARLGGRRGRLLEERFRLGEGGTVAHRAEQLCRLAEWLLGDGFSEGAQAAALAEEGVGVLGNVPELLPACGRFGVEGYRVGLVPGGFGEQGRARIHIYEPTRRS
jgi:hypothetical protein